MLQARLTAVQTDTNLSAQLDLIGRMSDQLDENLAGRLGGSARPGQRSRAPANNIRLSPIARLCASLEVSIAMYAAKGGEPPTEWVEFARQSKSAGANRTRIAGEAGMLISRLKALVAGVEVAYQR